MFPAADISQRASVLEMLGADSAVREELLSYNQNQFQIDLHKGLKLPLQDELFISHWRKHLAQQDWWSSLAQDFPQLSFPISGGMSSNAQYQQATRSGKWNPDVNALGLEHPGTLNLSIYQTPAGSIPIIVATERVDFERLVQAFSKRNEPIAVPASMGACMIAGLNNWGRVRTYRREWEAEQFRSGGNNDWSDEMKALTARKEAYQDRLILLSDGPYSGVAAHELGQESSAWKRYSLAIRWGHECTHYCTKRLFGSMRNNAFDEMIADFFGIGKALGRFDSSWFLHFMGLERYPRYRIGGRLQNYCADPALSEDAQAVLRTLLYRAAKNLEIFDCAAQSLKNELSASVLLALASCSLEELAMDYGPDLLRQRATHFERFERIT